MADKTMTLEIVTPEGVVLKDVITDAVVLPIQDGTIGILYNHAPMAAVLRTGVLRYRQDGKNRLVAVSGGFFELKDNRMVVLADTAEPAERIDIARAEAARERAQERLREKKAEVDRARAEAALKRALNRIRAAGQH